ncbi:mechanosensitive ion channel [Flavobacterium rakeshii]|uniref:Mechanosensitive ion channel n=1 Tax=Flavobacterium rakeshii TaxID=1038845 RepID=A0A6N8H7V3_9FLAO|nr:mechanosensitive ion channel domain-containing protein [Flavobacterium rakeshii]MEE1897803.1 mechanosensitive ion channel domain-containing protein [Flavobacterium rakeshii]MUV02694.1 mechanosensitive ion channel [Flavobacterium rakeshii]
MKNFESYYDWFVNLVLEYTPKILVAAGILIGGLIAIKLIRAIIVKVMKKREMDPTAVRFLLDILTWALRVMLFITVIGELGVQTSSFVAILGAAGLAIGLSLQGSLSNFAGGILIITFKPFRVGDYIEAQGEGGTVNEIQIFATKLTTPSNQVIYIPNGSLSNGNIKNYSKELTRRGEIIVGAGYGSNMKHVKDVLTKIVAEEPKILDEPAPIIRVKALADNSVNFQILAWAKNEDYWQMLSDVQENVKLMFDQEKIEIPFPQRDIVIRNLDTKNLPS